MTAESENMILAYIDSQLEERREKGFRELAEGLNKKIRGMDKGPEYTIEADVNADGTFTMTAHKDRQ